MQESHPKRRGTPKLKKSKKTNDDDDSDYEENQLVLLPNQGQPRTPNSEFRSSLRSPKKEDNNDQHEMMKKILLHHLKKMHCMMHIRIMQVIKAIIRIIDIIRIKIMWS